jgi:hypothetical protein
MGVATVADGNTERASLAVVGMDKGSPRACLFKRHCMAGKRGLSDSQTLGRSESSDRSDFSNF